MKTRKPIFRLISGTVVLILAGVVIATRMTPGDGTPEDAAPAPDRMLSLRGSDREKELVTSHKDLDPESKQEIVLLAGKLPDALGGGLDPDGGEAGACVMTMGILLKVKQTPAP